ncbi:hypothetical protein P43SY_011792 [Pythium insidiosum]|uniref:MULE transposase domain-containing protein n=1 Tax=Pythium insidiosum TaxID=114742 RepID=A0AAD5Q1T0_PYTIN|nr:hypothetical protein P43SY_011792 [Pythium insidiosum]
MKRFIRDKVKDKLKPSHIPNAMIDAGFFSTDALDYKDAVKRYAYNYRTRKRQQRPFKLYSARFPAIIIGISDARRQFHPVAFFIMSSTQQSVLEVVFRKPFDLYRMVTGKLAVINYTMADADIAQRNALGAVIRQDREQPAPPVHLMCFFHVMQNVRKYLHSVPPGLHSLALQHVYKIHCARSEVELDRRIHETVQDWKAQPSLCDFERRFSQQWLVGRFTRWQCFVTPAGCAKTNNQPC